MLMGMLTSKEINPFHFKSRKISNHYIKKLFMDHIQEAQGEKTRDYVKANNLIVFPVVQVRIANKV